MPVDSVEQPVEDDAEAAPLAPPPEVEAGPADGDELSQEDVSAPESVATEVVSPAVDGLDADVPDDAPLTVDRGAGTVANAEDAEAKTPLESPQTPGATVAGHSGTPAPTTPQPNRDAGTANTSKRSRGRTIAIFGGIAAAALIGVAAVLVGVNRDNSAASRASSTSVVAGNGLTGKCAKYDPAAATRGFNEPDSETSLGRTNTKKVWKTDAAVFGVSGNQAYVSSRLSGAPAQAVVTMSSSNAVVCATVSSVHLGTGIVFRLQDPANYWMFTAVPGYATWNVTIVQDGVPTLVGNTGLTTFEDGTVISAQTYGNKLNFFVNGKLRKSITSSKLSKARGFGIIASGDAAAADLGRWKKFVADTYSSAPPAPSGSALIASGNGGATGSGSANK